MAHLLKAEFREQILQYDLLLLTGVGRHLQYGTDIVLDAQFAEYRRLLGEVTDTLLRTFINGEAGDVLVAEVNITLIGLNKPHRHVERSSLTGAVRAQEADNLTLAHLDIDVVHHSAFAVLFHKILRAENKVAVMCISDRGISVSGSGKLYGRFLILLFRNREFRSRERFIAAAAVESERNTHRQL